MNTEGKTKSQTGCQLSKEEDQQLFSLVKSLGKDWEKISRIMGRTPRQVRDRFNFVVESYLNTQEWSLEEDYMLFEKVKELGTQWDLISQFFLWRSTRQIKKRWWSLSTTSKNSNYRSALEILRYHIRNQIIAANNLMIRNNHMLFHTSTSNLNVTPNNFPSQFNASTPLYPPMQMNQEMPNYNQDSKEGNKQSSINQSSSDDFMFFENIELWNILS